MSRRLAVSVADRHAGPRPLLAQRSLAIERFDATIQVEPDGAHRGGRVDRGAVHGVVERHLPHDPGGVPHPAGLQLDAAARAPRAPRTASGRTLRVDGEPRAALHQVQDLGAGRRGRDAHGRAALPGHNGLRFFEDHDELYWNVTGDEWDVPLEAVAARDRAARGHGGHPGDRLQRRLRLHRAGSHGRRARGTTVSVAMPHAARLPRGTDGGGGMGQGRGHGAEHRRPRRGVPRQQLAARHPDPRLPAGLRRLAPPRAGTRAACPSRCSTIRPRASPPAKRARCSTTPRTCATSPPRSWTWRCAAICASRSATSACCSG